ncbi:hypothetical protein D7Z26_03600 [Cohnella endophytica]|uniref:Uncharacterized protein n=1 Tax=Cohnella endophytica TaxID=2419778 RepID=A0A494Y4V8_9BACL|nr:hypothetical protein [Cohnella endophytica]RKP57080.1 hypothetical protein D7Z26_03600 [Cohnella endophytica]
MDNRDRREESNRKNSRNKDEENYGTLFAEWSGRIERRIARGILLLALLLILAQLVLQFPAMRRLLTTTDRSEGIPFHYVPR